MSKLPISDIIKRWNDLNEKLNNTTETDQLIALGMQQKKLQQQFDLANRIEHLEHALAENKKLLETLNSDTDAEMVELTVEDNTAMSEELLHSEQELLGYLAPTDERDEKNVIIELRAGAGGDESTLFAGELLKSYSIMASQLGLGLKIISASENTLGGYKEVIAEIHGSDAYSWYKYEAGVHRVQRVPATEKQGRVHTSTISVIAMPLIEADDKDFQLNMDEVEIIATTSSGKGGQSVNTTYSAISVRHLPTNIIAQCQDERNQAQNKVKALRVLTTRVYDFYEQQRRAKESLERKMQVSSADRSEKIRTYNFPQDRVTDHRYNYSWNQIETIMAGGILDVIKDIKRLEAERVIEQLGNED